jgi:hypothetical protein
MKRTRRAAAPRVLRARQSLLKSRPTQPLSPRKTKKRETSNLLHRGVVGFFNPLYMFFSFLLLKHSNTLVSLKYLHEVLQPPKPG